MGDDVVAEDRVRNALTALRTLLTGDRPISELATAEARAIVRDGWDALTEALTCPESGSEEIVRTLQQLRRIDELLLHHQGSVHADIARRLGDVLARLEMTPCSVAELVSTAPRLIGDLGFDRAIISRIADGLWITQQVFVADDPVWAETINRVGQEEPQPLGPKLFETEIVRRRQPILVSDAQLVPRVHARIAKESLSRSYVAAPILSNGRVVGLIHGDRYLQGVDTDRTDRETLRTFAEALRLALSRAQLAEQLDSAAATLRLAAAESARAIAGLHEVHLNLSTGSGTGHGQAESHPRSTPRMAVAVRERLTAREVQVLELMAQGRTNAAIAAELIISEGTAKQHVKHILRKLGAANRAEAVMRLYDTGEG
ncbi:LuxR C-terminal-related transcriptional regulator [Nocardia sp. NPDC004860]|uniref:LuxR C-terminal-related transcriptional regulator n=1 Tax=Nocardia sp. NPDC004860 TaxID=3154557 RepID=UPI0033A4F0EF